MAVTPIQNRFSPRFGKFTEAQQKDADRLWKPLGALPSRPEYDKHATEVLTVWDLYASDHPDLKEAFPKGKPSDQIDLFERNQLEEFRQCINDSSVNRLALLQRIRAFLEAMNDAEHYTPSEDAWTKFVLLADHQLKRSHKAISQLAAQD